MKFKFFRNIFRTIFWGDPRSQTAALVDFEKKLWLSISTVKEGRFVLGIFRSERMRVLYRSRQNDRLRVMLELVHIDITPPHTPCQCFGE
ncbi:hypothetical protein TNCV_835531 [Trichonephila clavipes]|nr:hypothetical protein TNCV_835531 [Trichonephila clavipes]